MELLKTLLGIAGASLQEAASRATKRLWRSKRLNYAIEFVYCTTDHVARTYDMMANGGMHDLRDYPDTKRRILGIETNDAKLMRGIRKAKSDAVAVRIVKFIKADANLLGLALDESYSQLIREAAVEQIESQDTLFQLALFRREPFIARAAVKQLKLQRHIVAVLENSPHVTVRMAAARLCNDGDLLLRVKGSESHPDIQWEAANRYRVITGSPLTTEQILHGVGGPRLLH